MADQFRQFAGRQHNLIYAFLNEKKWAVSEYYDIAAWGYLYAVKRYLSDPQLQRYSFSTIAWWAMKQSISSFCRAEARRKAAEQAFAAHMQPTSRMDTLDARLLLYDLALISSKEQYSFVKYRLSGHSVSETAKACGVSTKRVRKLLKELYRTYMK